MGHTVILGGLLLVATSVVAESNRLDEVVVTALRDTRNEQSAPVFVSVVEGEEGYAGQQSVLTLSSKAPSIRFMQTSGPLTTSARVHGIGNLGNIPNFETDVGIYVQGAYQSRQGLLAPQLFDLDAIEVIAGSQATRYGRNVNAGAVVVRYQEPTTETTAAINMTLGVNKGAQSAPLANAIGKANVSLLEDSLRIRASYKVSQSGGVDRNVFPRAEDDSLGEASDSALRLQVAMDAGEGQVTVMGFHSRSTAVQGDADVYYGTNPAALNRAFAVTCPDNDPTNGVQCINHGIDSELLYDALTLQMDYPLSDTWALQSLSGWSRYKSETLQDADQLNINIVEFNDQQKGVDWQQEIRVVWDAGGPFKGAAGVYADKTHFDRVPVDGRSSFVLGSAAPLVPLNASFAMGTSGASGSLFSLNRSQHLSVFGEATFQVSEALKIDASARYIDDRKKTHITHQSSVAGVNLINAALIPSSVDADLSRHTHGIAWNITPQLDLGEQTLVFATVARGFKPGGFNADWGTTTSGRREFQDETVQHRALGVKWHHASEKVRVSAVGFDDVFKQYQDGSFIGLQFLVGNAEEVRSTGVDISAEGLLPTTTIVKASLSYADTHYEKFTRGSCHYGRAPNSTTTAGACDLSGETLPNAPKVRTTLGIEHTFPGYGEGIETKLIWSHTSSYRAASSLDPRSEEDSVEDLAASIAVVPSRQVAVRLWAENILNERPKLAAAYMNLFSGDPAYQVFLAPGRSIGVTASLTF